MSSSERLHLQGITKAYPGCIANDAVELRVNSGEIHALLGENGAGKSTLMKIIYGVIAPDAGQLLWHGQPQVISGPSHARQLGIGMVFQHFSLFETLTVAENIALGLPADQAKDMAALEARIREVSEHYGMALDPKRLVYTLSVGEQQRVEIVRCLLQDIELLILDEPTSVLTPQEVQQLFRTLKTLASEGCSILFISHKLDEVVELCNAATVLRHGQVTGHCNPQHTTSGELARMMVGDDTPLSENYSKAQGTRVALDAKDLCYQPEDPFGVRLEQLALQVKAGEILGIAGVAGNGQDELMGLLSGEERQDSGSIQLNGTAIEHLSPDQRRQLGFAFVPEERLGRGAVPDMSLVDNALLSASHTGLKRKGWIRYPAVRQFARHIIDRYNVKCADEDAQAKSLSGGNLQKFIIGREIEQQPKFLVCSHPTWGVDIGAAILIRHSLIHLRDQGAAILVISEDIDELYQISDRIGAICDGRLSPIAPTQSVSIEQLGQWMAGQFSDPQPQQPEVSHA
ncbi:ABC transporter ATP-binding protein [Bacterioplanes sanyensis]|uniref:ABC transporter ATP-binding protein n=1 Tax=Bacterioplanes sanyensis TaxID=1249553 RepID=UPI001679C6CB|nr:ABC transporter ATP-binding protein [Bacterioplanes sanyensis]GGY36867.1 ABC transporter ATP-binding protein [Bacterioplanes sanyensis]